MQLLQFKGREPIADFTIGDRDSINEFLEYATLGARKPAREEPYVQTIAMEIVRETPTPIVSCEHIAYLEYKNVPSRSVINISWTHNLSPEEVLSLARALFPFFDKHGAVDCLVLSTKSDADRQYQQCDNWESAEQFLNSAIGNINGEGGCIELINSTGRIFFDADVNKPHESGYQAGLSFDRDNLTDELIDRLATLISNSHQVRFTRGKILQALNLVLDETNNATSSD